VTMTAPEFRAWLREAHSGDELTYHYGNLSRDSDEKKRRGSYELNRLIDAVVDARSRGSVTLRQAKLPGTDEFEHIARKV
jgi:hypothetical protein